MASRACSRRDRYARRLPSATRWSQLQSIALRGESRSGVHRPFGHRPLLAAAFSGRARGKPPFFQSMLIASDASVAAAAGDFAGAEPFLAQPLQSAPTSGQALHRPRPAGTSLQFPRPLLPQPRMPLERAAQFPARNAQLRPPSRKVKHAGSPMVLGELPRKLLTGARPRRRSVWAKLAMRHRPQQGTRARCCVQRDAEAEQAHGVRPVDRSPLRLPLLSAQRPAGWRRARRSDSGAHVGPGERSMAAGP